MKPFSLFLSASILLAWPCHAQAPHGLENLTTDELLEKTKSDKQWVAHAADRELTRTGHEPTIRRHLELLKAGDPERSSAFIDGSAVGLRTFPYLFEALPSASFEPLPGEIYQTSRAPAISLGIAIAEGIKEGDFPQDTLVWAEKQWEKIRNGNSFTDVLRAEAIEELVWWWEHNQEAVKAGRPQDAAWVPTMENSPRVRRWLDQVEKGDAAEKLAAQKRLVKAGHEPTILRLLAALPDTPGGGSPLEELEDMSWRTLPVLFQELGRAFPTPPAAGPPPAPDSPPIRLMSIIFTTIRTQLGTSHSEGWARKHGQALYAAEPADYAAAVHDTHRRLEEWWDANGDMIRYERPRDAVWLCKTDEPLRIAEMLEMLKSGNPSDRWIYEQRLVDAGHAPTIDRLARELVEQAQHNSALTLPYARHINRLEIVHRWLPESSMEMPTRESRVIRRPSRVMLGMVFFDTIRNDSRFPALTRRWAKKMRDDVLLIDPKRPREEIDAAFQSLDDWWEHNKAAVQAGRPQEAAWLPEVTGSGR